MRIFLHEATIEAHIQYNNNSIQFITTSRLVPHIDHLSIPTFIVLSAVCVPIFIYVPIGTYYIPLYITIDHNYK